MRFLVPETALTLEFMPALFQVEAGTFDLDDVVLQPTDAAPLRVAAAAAEAAKLEKQTKDATAKRAKAARHGATSRERSPRARSNAPFGVSTCGVRLVLTA